MCLLIVYEDKFPTRRVLELGASRNPHGAGIAWVEDGKVKWKKGLKLEELFNYEDKTGPGLVHFRLSTVGGDNPLLCHPFPVSETAEVDLEGEADKVLAHNGHWMDWQKCVSNVVNRDKPLPPAPWSDTRGIAWLTSHYGDDWLDWLSEKVAVLDKNGIQPYGRGWHRDNENNLLLSYNPYESYFYYDDEYEWYGANWSRGAYKTNAGGYEMYGD